MDIVFVEAENAGNVGAVARVMKNFGFSRLVLLNPQCDHLGKEAMDRATHAKDILKKAAVVDSIDYDYLIGTTAALGTDYNLLRSPLTPRDAAAKASCLKCGVGLLIGREGKGLSNEELERCDIVVTIPTPEDYPTLNASHALAVILYEFSLARDHVKTIDRYAPASAKDKEVTLGYISKVIDSLDMDDDKKRNQQVLWKKILGKAALTKRESYAVMGFFKRL